MSDNDAETLTENEREHLYASNQMGDALGAIERILTARIAAVRASERERLATQVRALADKWDHIPMERGCPGCHRCLRSRELRALVDP